MAFSRSVHYRSLADHKTPPPASDHMKDLFEKASESSSYIWWVQSPIMVGYVLCQHLPRAGILSDTYLRHRPLLLRAVTIKSNRSSTIDLLNHLSMPEPLTSFHCFLFINRHFHLSL